MKKFMSVTAAALACLVCLALFSCSSDTPTATGAAALDFSGAWDFVFKGEDCTGEEYTRNFSVTFVQDGDSLAAVACNGDAVVCFSNETWGATLTDRTYFEGTLTVAMGGGSCASGDCTETYTFQGKTYRDGDDDDDGIDETEFWANYTRAVAGVGVECAPPITGEAIGTGNGAKTAFSATLSASPVIASFVTVTTTTTGGPVTGYDDGEGAITGAGIASGTIDYASGAISVTFSSPVVADVDVTVDYSFITYLCDTTCEESEGMFTGVITPPA